MIRVKIISQGPVRAVWDGLNTKLHISTNVASTSSLRRIVSVSKLSTTDGILERLSGIISYMR